MYFEEPSSAAIYEALERFESMKFDPDKVKNHVQQFSQENFSERLQSAVFDLAARAG